MSDKPERWLFELSEAERKHLQVSVPEKYHNRGDDWVSFRTIKDGPDPAAKKKADWVKDACFAKLRPWAFDRAIECRPYKEPLLLSLAEIQEFFAYLQEAQLALPRLEFREEGEGQVILRIPEQKGQPNLRHRGYVTLTGYRWVDSHPGLAWEFLQISRRDDKLTPFQILPYLIAEYIRNLNHSFLNSYEPGQHSPGRPYSYASNPVLGQAFRTFFSSEYPGDRSTDTNTLIGKLTENLTPTIKLSSAKAWNNLRLEIKYALEKPVDLLHPALKPLYATPGLSKEELEKLLASLFTKERAIN